MIKYGLRRCYVDHTIFVIRKNLKVVILVVYVVDIVVTGNGDDEITKLDLLEETGNWVQNL